MGTKPHTHNRKKIPKVTPFEIFVEDELKKSLIELVNAKSWARSYIALGQIKTISRLVDGAIRSTGNRYQQIINVEFRRLR